MRFYLVGCTHQHSSVEVRERLAFNATQVQDSLQQWKEKFPQIEAVLISTCNRVEFYAASNQAISEEILQQLNRYLASYHQVPYEEVEEGFILLQDEAVIDHLFRVSASLDSMVLGEPQIMSQVKQAYEIACECSSAGQLTHNLFQTAMRVGRRVASETSLHSHRVSIPSVAIVDFAGRIFERFDDKQVLVIGAGEMAEETLRYLVDEGAKNITIINRSQERAVQLAKAWNGKTAHWDSLWDEIIAADLIISTTSATEPIVSHEEYVKHVMPARKQRPLFLLDLAIPRDFDGKIAAEIATYLYSIDDLQAACEKNRQSRANELPAAEEIVKEETENFLAESRHRATVPVITQLRRGFETPKLSELERLFKKLPDLDARSKKEIEQFADRLVNKMLHPPLQSLRTESKNGSPQGMLDALSRLFQLKE